MYSPANWLYNPDFPEHWERHSLYGLARWVNGLAFRDIHFSTQRKGKPVIKIAEVKNGITGQTKYTEQAFDTSVHVGPCDLIFSWSGQPETSIDVFRWRGPDGWLNQHLFRVTPDPRINERFFYYLLRYLRPHFVGIARNKQTTGLGHVTKRDLEALVVGIPPLAEQRAIAEVLGALDDKIEANRRAQDCAERLARAELTRAQQEEAESDVPIGRLVERVAEIISPTALAESVVYVGLEHMPRGSMLLKEHGITDGLVSAKTVFRPRDVLFGKLRPYFKKVVVAPSTGVCSTDILVLRPILGDWAVATAVCASDDVIDYATAGSEGTRMPRVSWEYLARYEVPLPGPGGRQKLEAKIAPLLEFGMGLTVELAFRTLDTRFTSPTSLTGNALAERRVAPEPGVGAW
ncbi:MAG: restriction endonuclease subunit S [Acidimicrobiales bacterium]